MLYNKFNIKFESFDTQRMSPGRFLKFIKKFENLLIDMQWNNFIILSSKNVDVTKHENTRQYSFYTSRRFCNAFKYRGDALYLVTFLPILKTKIKAIIVEDAENFF